MTNSINPYGNINNTQYQKQVALPKTDRRFQTFVDEALKETKPVDKQSQTARINISNHAEKRMAERGIALDETDMANLETAFQKLDNKGAENSLIIYDDLSLIASVKNRTIITASKSSEMSEVTNIDSAILLNK